MGKKNELNDDELKIELSEANNVETDLTFIDVLSAACGVDETGVANGSALISIDEFVDDKHTIVKNAPMDCEFNIYCEGGAIVLQCDFTQEYLHEYNAILELCDMYIEEKMNNPDIPWILNVGLVPMPLEGMCIITFMGITYYTGIPMEDGKYRVILVFDNTLTEVFGTDDIDFDVIKLQIESEYARKEQEIEDEIYEAQLELEKLKKFNPFEDEIKNMYSDKAIDDINVSDEDFDELEEDDHNV